MAREGYVPGIPNSTLAEDCAIDAEFCADSTCEKCGHKGLKYRPFVDRSTQSYRAFAECPKCGSVRVEQLICSFLPMTSKKA